jgi:hypothetical protein
VSDLDTYSLPPTQALVVEILAARARLGENHWTFSTRHRPALEALAGRGLVHWKAGIVERTCLAWLTEPGRAAALSEAYRTPAVRLLEDALFLRMNGERPPGHAEATWRAWEPKAEAFLRSLLPPDPEDEGGA